MNDPLTTQVDNLTQLRSEIVSEIATLRGNKQKVHSELIALAETKGRFVAEIDGYKKEISALQDKKSLLKSTTDNDVAELQSKKDALLGQIAFLESYISFMTILKEDMAEVVDSVETLRDIAGSEKYLARSAEEVLKRHILKLESTSDRIMKDVLAKASEVSSIMDSRVEKLVQRENTVRNKEKSLKVINK